MENRVHDDNDGQDIVIERRETIGIVSPSPFGDKSMLEAAYATIGRYLTDEAGGTHAIEIMFKYRGAEFLARYTPTVETDRY